VGDKLADSVHGAQRRLADLLDQVATATTGGGSLAAVALALAAVVTGTAARQAKLGGFDAQADSLRRRAVELAVTDAEAFARALVALHPEQHGLAPTGDTSMEAALDHGVDVLTQIVVLANDVAQLAAAVAEGAESDFRADAVASSMLAAAAADIAVHLVSETLLVGPDDDRLARVRVVAANANEATHRVARHWR
jgi:formiminotetrahydrofolate cyclodeaminase